MGELPDSLPELRQHDPKTFDQEQLLVVLDSELSAVSEEDANSESVSMDDKSLRLLKRPLVLLNLQSRPALW